MKKFITLSSFGLMMFCTSALFAQQQSTGTTNNKSNSESQAIPVVADPVISTNQEHQAPPVATSGTDKEIILIEGRKVNVDRQGVQSLAAPEQPKKEILHLNDKE